LLADSTKGALAMFGIFKKQITLVELGQGIVQLVNEPISSDCSRALGMRFQDWDGSKGWSNFLQSRGIAIPTQKFHYRLWMHAAIQATCTQFDEAKRRTITQSAMEAFSEKIPSYNVGSTYEALEAAYRGQYKFDPRLAPLSNAGAAINFLPNPQVGVQNAKYLIEIFVLPQMPNSAAFIEEFPSYSSTACASIGTVSRAIDHILSSFKI
jgi:hypothetical protein